MADEPNLLGEYVRARRELVTPEQAKIPVFGVRRVPGLRREEVALLAGISADYYLRLEQGRDRNPSVQVLEAIARVLRLDDTATAHLLRLGADGPRRHRARPHRRKETVPPSITALLKTLPLPAMVEGRYFDVLAANPLATALSPRFTPGANRLRSLFLDPAEQALHPQWEKSSGGIVAAFREAVGTDTDDPGSSSWSVNSPWPALCSAASGPATTSSPAGPRPSTWTTPRSAPSISTASA